MSFWKKIIGKKKNTKSIVVYERENKKLWDYVRLLTELLEEKDKEIKGLNSEIKKIENKTSSSTSIKKTDNNEKDKTAKSEKSNNKKAVAKKNVKTSKTASKQVAKKQEKTKDIKKETTKKKNNRKELSKEDVIISFMKSKKNFLDYKAISVGTKIPESVVRTMISRMKKKGINLEEKKEGKKKLIKFKK